MDENFETQRGFRWVWFSGDSYSVRVRSIRCRLDPTFDLVMTVEFTAFETTDLSDCPVKGHSASLKLLNETGEVNSEYTIVWRSLRLIPFLELRYDTSDLAVQAVELRNVWFMRRPH